MGVTGNNIIYSAYRVKTNVLILHGNNQVISLRIVLVGVGTILPRKQAHEFYSFQIWAFTECLKLVFTTLLVLLLPIKKYGSTS